MASLKETKRRIASVKSTQKITRAMKLVSSAKFAKANIAISKAEPYFNNLTTTLGMAICQGEELNLSALSPLLAPPKGKRALMILLGSDRGLCGGLNANLIKAAHKVMKEREGKGFCFDLGLWGRRCAGVEKFGARKVFEKREKLLEDFSYSLVKAESHRLCELYITGKYDEISIVYPKFKNALSQEPTVERIFPVDSEKLGAESFAEEAKAVGALFEPSREGLLQNLIQKYLAAQLYKFFLSASASEHAARMTAMDSATNNAEEVVKSLTLDYNRARQAAITKELIEITSGAEAL